VKEITIPLNTQLPHSYPFLLIDRVMEFEAGKSIVCIKNVSCNEDVLQGYHPENNIFPPVYIIEAMAQSSGLLMAGEKVEGGFLTMIRDAKFHRTVNPGDSIIITSSLFHKMSPLHVFEAKATVNDHLAAEAEITLTLTETP
jgi:beta-hydroxyacyl-ACP dehydratase FabZ